VVAAGLAVAAGCGTVSDVGGTGTTVAPATTEVPADGALLAWCDEVPVPEPIADTEPPVPNPDLTLMGVVNRYAAEHPETFGGLWIDQVHGGTVVLSFTDDPAAHRAAIAGLTAQPGDPTGVAPAATIGPGGAVDTPPPTAPPSSTVAESPTVVDVVQVAHSDRELQAIRDEVAGTLMDDDALQVSSAGINAMTNRVTLDVDGEVDDQVRRTLATRVPVDAACVIGGPPTEPPFERPATMIPAEGSDPWVTCRGTSMPFRLSALDDPLVLAPDDPLRVAFEELISGGGMGSADQYRLLARTDEVAVYAWGDPPTSFVQMRMERGRWISGGSVSGAACTPKVLLPEGVAELEWSLDPDHPAPQPGDTVLHLLVSRLDCSGGEPVGDDDLVGPEVVERGGQVLLAVGVEPMPPGSYTCIGTMPEPIDVTLPEPLPAGELVDATYVPPRPVATGTGGR
jgi:hypothetical protein